MKLDKVCEGLDKLGYKASLFKVKRDLDHFSSVRVALGESLGANIIYARSRGTKGEKEKFEVGVMSHDRFVSDLVTPSVINGMYHKSLSEDELSEALEYIKSISGVIDQKNEREEKEATHKWRRERLE